MDDLEKRELIEALRLLCSTALSGGYLSDALDNINGAIDLDPSSATLHAIKANVHLKMIQPYHALDAATSAIRINPNYAKGYKYRGIARAKICEWVEALEDLHTASQLDHDEEIAAEIKKVEPHAHGVLERRRIRESLQRREFGY